MKALTRSASLSALVLCAAAAQGAETLAVGPGKKYAKPSQAIAAAKDRDIIEIDAAGKYVDDSAKVRANRLTLRGVGEGRAVLRCTKNLPNGKGIFVTKGSRLVIENIEFIGARVRDRNGAGIRADGKDLTVRNCRFHDCQDAILGGAGVVLIEHCEFSHNGKSRHPVTHNLYMSRRVDKLIYRFNYSHFTDVGHLLKSRAKENHILYNRLTDEDGTGSYVINLPNGGKGVIIGNVLHKGRRGSNTTIIAYGEEGKVWPRSELTIINNTMINEYPRGKPWFIRVRKVPEDFKLVVKNNLFAGRGTVCNWAKAEMAANFAGDPKFVDRAKWDLRLRNGSPCIDKGVDPGNLFIKHLEEEGKMHVERRPLRPRFQYVHPHAKEKRPTVGKLDIGAYEYVPAK